MNIPSNWRRRHRAMSSVTIALLLAGMFGLTAISATIQAASAAPVTGDFTIPAGGTATISGADWSACDQLNFGYEVNLGSEVSVATKTQGCEFGVPVTVTGPTTIGPFATAATVTIYLTDVSGGTYTYLSDGGGAANHALVGISNPYSVDLMDSNGATATTSDRLPDGAGSGNVTLTLTVNPPNFTAAPAATIAATEATSLSNVTVASISDTNLSDSASQFSASISWGDGTPTSTGGITGSNGVFAVTGSHTFASPGTYQVSVSITESGNPATETVVTKAAITAASLVGKSVTVPAATTNVAFTTPVATFVDGNTAALTGSYGATVSWGDGTSSAGAITGTGTAGSFSVSGTHTYTAHGTTTNPVSVHITSNDGASATVTDNNVSVADAVIPCKPGTCNGSLTSPTVTAQAQTSSTGAGDLFLSSDPNSGATVLSCGDQFRHAPRIITETNTFSTATGSITTTETFLNKNGIAGKGLEGLLYAICFQSKNPFVDLVGKTVTLGLLPLCNPFKPGPGPCVNYILPGAGGTIVEKITYPAGDPRYG